MSEQEKKEFEKVLRSYRKMLAGNKQASIELLRSVGIVTKKGNLKKNYTDLCIQLDRA